MSNEQQIIDSNLNKDYEYGFVSDIESDTIPPGLNEEVIRTISKKKEEPQWLLDWRLKAFSLWKKSPEPTWANVKYERLIVARFSALPMSMLKTLEVNKDPPRLVTP